MRINIVKSPGVISAEIIPSQAPQPAKRHAQLKLPHNPGLDLAFQEHLLARVQMQAKLRINNPQKDRIANLLPERNNVPSLHLPQRVHPLHD